MESLFHDDDGRRLDALLVTVVACQLDGGFVGLTAGIAEKHFLHARTLAQLVGQCFLAGHPVKVGGVQHATGLLGDGRHQSRMGMAQRIDGDPGECVQVFPALGIRDPAPAAVAECHRQTGVGIHDMRHEATPKNENGGHRRRNDRNPGARQRGKSCRNLNVK